MSDESFQVFADLDLPPALHQGLEKMKFVEPTPVQAATIPDALKGRDVLGIAQTGTGKTAAFGIPMLTRLFNDRYPIGLVLAPTRELAAQIHKVLEQMSSQGMKLHGALMVGGESFRKQSSQYDRGLDFIVATPGRLIDHLRQKSISLERAELLVLDEVDRILDMGFAPQIEEIMRHVPKRRQTLLFSATMPPEIQNLANRFLKNPLQVSIGGDVAMPAAQIEEQTIETTLREKQDLLIHHLRKKKGKILIFCKTKDRCEILYTVLNRERLPCVRLHGDCSQGERKSALESFRRGKPDIMVATDLAGRGIDIVDIEHVINYDLPHSREDYIHRIGRTARAGRSGTALNFLTPGDIDGYYAISNKKAPARTVFRSRKRR